jgi:diaminohydroxyphosphoribosylaminopyrimidine deaminase/5-amino-6-(5-phosphoribosylamino)uracil reductase
MIGSSAGFPAPDRYWMEQALALAALGEGTTSPNPRVGCVVVKEGEVIGRGFHQAPGLPHAEAMALTEAGDAAQGATLYVNLEPCAHDGRTPPCTDMLERCGVTRVVAAVQDPNPLVNGRGFDRLREAGMAVEVGLLKNEAKRLNAPFMHWHLHGRPLVTLKAAVTLDGMISAAAGESRWITGPSARRFAHRLRLAHDAVLVGAGTVKRDDPRLTVRLASQTRSRLRVVLAPGLDLDPAAKIFELADPTWPRTRVYAAVGENTRQQARFEGRADVVRVSSGESGLDLHQVLEDLAGFGVQSVMVEGGGRTFASFVRAGLADRAAFFMSGRLIGAHGGTSLIEGASVADPSGGFRLAETRQFALDEDLLFTGRLVLPGRAPLEARCSPD